MDFFIPLIAINLCLIISQNPEFLENTIFVVDQIEGLDFLYHILMEVCQLVELRTFPQYLVFKPSMIITAIFLYFY